MSNGPWGISMKKLGGQMLGCRWTKLLPTMAGHTCTISHTPEGMNLPPTLLKLVLIQKKRNQWKGRHHSRLQRWWLETIGQRNSRKNSNKFILDGTCYFSPINWSLIGKFYFIFIIALLFVVQLYFYVRYVYIFQSS